MTVTTNGTNAKGKRTEKQTIILCDPSDIMGMQEYANMVFKYTDTGFVRFDNDEKQVHIRTRSMYNENRIAHSY